MAHSYSCHFIQSPSSQNVIKEPNCFKFSSPTSINLILIRDTPKVSNSKTIETGMSDFHVLVTASFEERFHKNRPKIFTYRDYEPFDIQVFNADVREANDSIPNIRKDFSLYKSTVKTLNKHASLKQKYIRASNAAFV